MGAVASDSVLVDSSAWIEFFRGTSHPVVERLVSLVRDEGHRVCTTDMVRAELLAGARTTSDAHRIGSALNRARQLPARPFFDFEAAAALYRHCRGHGVTPRQLTDCLIAAVAIHHGVSILTTDRDFAEIASVSGLRLA